MAALASAETAQLSRHNAVCGHARAYLLSP
eukprot:SAG31_NODE_18455_length_635_cov_2.046642_1_plen_29_part_10